MSTRDLETVRAYLQAALAKLEDGPFDSASIWEEQEALCIQLLDADAYYFPDGILEQFFVNYLRELRTKLDLR